MKLVRELESVCTSSDTSLWVNVAILDFLSRNDALTVGELTDLLRLREYDVSRRVGKLIRHGFVMHEKNETDLRKVYVRLSDTGASFLDGLERLVSICGQVKGSVSGRSVHKRALVYLEETRHLIDSGPITLIINTVTGEILDANKAAEIFYGWTREQLRAKTLAEISLSSPEKIEREFGAVQKSGFGILHVTHRVASGDTRDLEVHASFGLIDATPVHVSIIIDKSDWRGRGYLGECGKFDPYADANIGLYFSPFFSRYERDIPAFSDMLQRIFAQGRIVTYRQGEHFLELGEDRRSTVFILSGLFRKYSISPDGKDYTLSLFHSGEIINATALRGKDEDFSFALESLDESTVFIIPNHEFQFALDEDPRWYKLLFLDQRSKLEKSNAREFSLRHDNAYEKYRWFLAHDRDSLDRLRNYHIASYLGITSETLSRVRRKFGN